MSVGFLADFNGIPGRVCVSVGANTVPGPGDALSGCSTSNQGAHTATSGDILWATRGDVCMATTISDDLRDELEAFASSGPRVTWAPQRPTCVTPRP